jgi:hypothetical protein
VLGENEFLLDPRPKNGMLGISAAAASEENQENLKIDEFEGLLIRSKRL